jgi:hypothetical protein
MALDIQLTAPIARNALAAALDTLGYTGGPLSVDDMRALDIAELLVPATRYPANSIPAPLMLSGIASTQYGSSSTTYFAADLLALDADAVVAAVAEGRAFRGAA